MAANLRLVVFALQPCFRLAAEEHFLKLNRSTCHFSDYRDKFACEKIPAYTE